MNDPVNHPEHYKSGKYEVIDIIEAFELPFHLGNAIKYILRAGKKKGAPALQDIAKAKWYVDRFLNKDNLQIDQVLAVDLKDAFIVPTPEDFRCAEQVDNEKIHEILTNDPQSVMFVGYNWPENISHCVVVWQNKRLKIGLSTEGSLWYIGHAQPGDE